MAKKVPTKKPSIMKHTHYKLEADKIARDGKFCPRCGMGVFLAEHVDRLHCGKCSYTEFKRGVPKFRAKPGPKAKPKPEAPKPAPKKEEAPATPAEVPKQEPKKEAPKVPVKKSKKVKKLQKGKKK